MGLIPRNTGRRSPAVAMNRDATVSTRIGGRAQYLSEHTLGALFRNQLAIERFVFVDGVFQIEDGFDLVARAKIGS